MVESHAYDTAIGLNQANSDAWMERSVSFNKAGDFNNGFEYLDKAVELEPESTWVIEGGLDYVKYVI